MSTQAELGQLEIQVNILIRRLQADDLPRLEWYGQFRHYRRLFRRSYQGQLRGNRLLLVADVRGFPVGRLFIQFYSPNSQVSDGRTRAYLYSFQVMEMFQGHGIGTRLIQSAEMVLRQRNFQYASIAVAKNNDGALSLYERHNYIIVAEDDGKWSYLDHRGRECHVDEPCWMLEKTLST
ncbi:MAG: GNAT family N-acetyltransferase [Anaerolineae bacterium]